MLLPVAIDGSNIFLDDDDQGVWLGLVGCVCGPIPFSESTRSLSTPAKHAKAIIFAPTISLH
jgi:hypothetical protein